MTAAGMPVVAVANRSGAHAAEAVRLMASGAPAAKIEAIEIARVPAIASRVLIAVADQAIEGVAATLAASGMRRGLALHTCGAKGTEALAPLSASGVGCGMLHPLQTIPGGDHGARSLDGVTFGVSGDPAAVDWAIAVADALHGRTLGIDVNRLSYYHAGAVMASNALLASLDAATALFAAAGIEESEALNALGPLARTSVANALAIGPLAALTGPVVRGDASTVAAHVLAVGRTDPTVDRLYRAAADRLLQLAKRRGLSEAQARAVHDVITGHRRSVETVAGE
jgi:predicted short-subunit dehydrogenase-like oxidoreductase (DUF2520 family)